MDLHQLRCFLVVADELHFGRAAQRLYMLPSALGRYIKLLEDGLGAKLFHRTTRAVSLTDEGATLVPQARELLAQADAIVRRFRERADKPAARRFRIGAIDSAAAGLLPQLLRDLHASHPEIPVQLSEDKTIRLMPKLISGALDLAFIRPPERPDMRLEILPLLKESSVVALPDGHRLARRRSITIFDIEDEPLIVPDRRSRPHSHDLTIKLFEKAGCKPQIAEVADEKQTIVNLAAARLGIAIVPRWTARMSVPGLRFMRLRTAGDTDAGTLQLAAAWLKDVRDPVREAVVATLTANAAAYARTS